MADARAAVKLGLAVIALIESAIDFEAAAAAA